MFPTLAFFCLSDRTSDKRFHHSLSISSLSTGGQTPCACYTLFCLRVAQAVPNHRHLPVAKELGRLAVQSFRRRVALWRADDAPVGGQRFADYLRIARLTAVYIEQG